MKFYAIALQWNFDSPYLAKLLKINFLWDICNTCLTKPWKLLSRETLIVHLLQNPWAGRSCSNVASATFRCSRVRILAPISIRNPFRRSLFHIHMLKGFASIRFLKAFASIALPKVLHRLPSQIFQQLLSQRFRNFCFPNGFAPRSSLAAIF